MKKEEFTQKIDLLHRQIEETRKEYLATNQPIEVGKLVTVYQGKDVYLKGMLVGYTICNYNVYFEIAPLTKKGSPHRTQRRSYDINDRFFKVTPCVRL